MEKGKRSQTKKVTSKKSPWVREFSAGGVVYKKVEREKLLWLIIQPKGTDRWQLPKGHIDKGEKSKIAAVREVQEEGGVNTVALEKLGDQRYFFQMDGKKIVKTVTFYLMEYVGETDLGSDLTEIEKVSFVSFEESQKLLSFKNDRLMVQKGNEIVSRGVVGSLV